MRRVCRSVAEWWERKIAEERAEAVEEALNEVRRAVKVPRNLSLTITHNDHAVMYQSAQQWIDDQDCDWFETAESRKRSMESGEVWEVQWYPDTPIGSYIVHAPTLEEALDYACRVQADADEEQARGGEHQGQSSEER